MKGYLKSKDIKKLLCVKQHSLDNLFHKRKDIKEEDMVKPVRSDDAERPGRNYTLDDLRKLGRIFYGDIYTKVYRIQCPCGKPMQISLSDIIMQQLKG